MPSNATGCNELLDARRLFVFRFLSIEGGGPGSNENEAKHVKRASKKRERRSDAKQKDASTKLSGMQPPHQ